MIKVIDYRAGNASSVLHALDSIGHQAELSRTAADLDGASHIILPGVGSAAATIESLQELNILPALENAIQQRKTPFLGICIGMQILFDHSEEDDMPCLGWISGRVVKFDIGKLRVPQMGWNKVQFPDGAFEGDMASDYFYFVNSYYAKPADESVVWGIADYGAPFAAAVRQDNIYATQFHIEKSGAAGLELLQGFLNLKTGGTTC